MPQFAPDPQIEQSRQTTLSALARIEDSTLLQLSRLTLPEIQAIKQEVAQVFPAGNLPAFVLSDLLKLKGRAVNPQQVHQDIATLLRGMSLVPQGLYSVLVAGPATVLYAYQKLIELSGKDESGAFPHGTWQFYLQFGLREDAARHANETIGFHRTIGSRADPASMAAAWLCAAMDLLFRFDDQDRMQISLRDFRPFVPLLVALGEPALADALAQDDLASYVAGLNRFVAELNALIALQAPA